MAPVEVSARRGVPGTVGMLCGSGLLPVYVARSLRERGARVVAVGIKGEAGPELEGAVDRVEWTGIARLGRWIRIFKKARVDVLLMVGGIAKRRMYDDIAGLLPDWRSARLFYRQIKAREDHTILGAVAAEFEKDGIRVGSVADLCPELLIQPGPLTSRQPTEEQWRDIRFAWPLAKQIAAMQIGQCIVVKDRAVVAVEAIEGTDAAIERGGRLAKGAAVAVKVPRAAHDARFDIPCIGPDTVDGLHRHGVDVLAVEAGGTVLLEERQTARRADEAGVCIVAVTADDVAPHG